jgi:hypothetical protein
MVSFQDITRILEITDRLALDRESIEIPLSAARPGKIHRLPNGKLEIIVDADLPFDDWILTVEPTVRQLLGGSNG